MRKTTTFWHRMLAVTGGFLLSLAGTQTALATGWVDATSPISSDLYGIDCVSGNWCVGVGASGTVVRNTSRTAWIAGTSGVSTNLNDVDMYTSSLGFAVGDSGTILKTTDTGSTWSTLTSGTTEHLYDIRMASSTVGYAVGEDTKIMKTTNGGTSWTNVATTGIDARAVDAYSTSIVWVVGKSGNIFKTTDGGTTWSDISYGGSNVLHSIDVVSSTVAYVGGENRLLLKTTDGGTTWTQVLLPDFGTTETVLDITMLNSTIGTVVGNAGTIASSTDGTTWTEDTMANTLSGVYGGALVATGSRFAVGAGGGILIYDNYGPNAPENFVMTDGDYTNDTTPSFTWDAATDDEGADIASYEFSQDGSSWSDIGLATSLTLSSPVSVGTKTYYVRAVDEVGNTGDDASIFFVVETTNPTVGSVSPTSATTGTATQFTVEASDASGIDSCSLYVNATNKGEMTLDSVSGDYYLSQTFSSAGSYSAYANCTDLSGNSASGSTVTVTVTGSTTSSDTTSPSVGTITPTTATEDTAVTLSASYADAVGVTSCTLYVGGSSQGSMTLSSGTARKSHTFASSGSTTAYAKCYDSAGNVGTGSSVTITVSAASSEEEEAADEAAEGDLIKMACPGGEDVNHPCRAVYFYGDDGKRHAFPNEKVFFTWYADFDDVVVVTDDYIASLTLGRNVTYHPGTKMVKFPSLNTVYAVGETGELRAVGSEDVARSLYGSNWNTKIDDISEAFYGNYRFGDDIDSSSDYDVDDAVASMDSILDLF